MSALFENAIDSLRMGVGYFVNRNVEKPLKHAILAVYHSIELLLKERLRKDHPLLVYRDIGRPIDDSSTTVGLDEAIVRLRNISVEIGGQMQKDLLSLKKRRNRIEHYEYIERDQDNADLGKALHVVYEFLERHLNTRMEDHLNEEDYGKVRELILSYEERMTEAERSIRALLPGKPKDQIGFPAYLLCPECGNETITVEEGGSAARCHFCSYTGKFAVCEYCGELLPEGDIDELGMCDWCSEARRR